MQHALKLERQERSGCKLIGVLAALLAALACGLPGVAEAQPAATRATEGAPAPGASEPTRIVLVARPGMDDLAHRFVAELRSLRFEVLRAADVAAPPTTAELEALALEQGARAAVRVEALESSVDLWLVNPHSHEVIYRRVVSERDPAVAVLRALEILRGALVDLQALRAPPVPRPEPVAAPPPAPPPPPRAPAIRSPWSIRLAAGALLPHAGSDASGAGLLAGHYRFARHFAIDAEAGVSLSAFSVEGSGGRADIRMGALLLGASVVPWPEARVSPSLGLGWGGLGLLSQGRAAAGFRGTTELRFAGLPHTRLRIGLRLSAQSSLSAGLVAGLATPRPVLLLAEQRISNWLNPLLIASLGWEHRFP